VEAAEGIGARDVESEATKAKQRSRSVLTAAEAAEAFAAMVASLGATEVAVVKNPAGIYAPLEFYPLAPRRERLRALCAVVMDMDGTTTTTEPLCLHSLEDMVRSTMRDGTAWAGLDHDKDLPFVVGNSTTRHVEHLLEDYSPRIDPEAFCRRLLWTTAWTCARGRDAGRKTETVADIAALGLGALATDAEFLAWGGARETPAPARFAALVPALAEKLWAAPFPLRVRCAVTIYYQRYHHILELLDEGRTEGLARRIFKEDRLDLIEPMPGVAVFLAMVKGMLGDEAESVYPALAAQAKRVPPGSREGFVALCRRLAARPAKLGIVTSSIAYEARIVLREVLRVVRRQVEAWPVSAGLRQRLLALFRDTDSLYDAFITASDSSEIRLKPHRDLYAIALHRFGVPVADYDAVIGFEDSASGVTAIKAAGCGMCVAVPFESTRRHDFTAADYIAWDGFPELMLERRMFLDAAP
jgi:beta-phosphoglucomutase-like phosphatase (HAD superfamily)